MEGVEELYEYAKKLIRKDLILRPKISCDVIFEDFFHGEVSLSKYNNTRYANIVCEFKELDGEEKSELVAQLRIPLITGFKPLYELMQNYKDRMYVRVKIEREKLKYFKLTVIDKGVDANDCA